jgi:biotin operon repressor
MSKTWEMKRRILELLAKNNMMPSEISGALGLSPSTVTQHLKELERVGAIREVPNAHVKKWKHYELNKAFDVNDFERGITMTNKIPYAIVGVVILIGAAFVLLASPNIFANGTQQIPIQLTDPPVVPSGTQALMMGYSSVQVHTTGDSNSTGWINASGSGTLNLMSLINESQVIGSAGLTANASINLVRFNVTSATIVVNGTSYNVTVPSGRVTARISGDSMLNGSSSVLLDMSPVVATIYTNTSTVFVLVPSIKAVVVPKTGISTQIGSKAQLSTGSRSSLDAARPNISISSAVLDVNLNGTYLAVTVTNNANSSIVLRHVLLTGNESVSIRPPGITANASGGIITTIGNAPSGTAGNLTTGVQDRPGIGLDTNISVVSNTPRDGNYSASGGTNGTAGENTGRGSMRHQNNSIDVTSQQNASTSEGAQRPTGENGSVDIVVGNEHIGLNTSLGLKIGEGEQANNLIRIGENIRNFRVLNFIISPNGQLFLPFGPVSCGRVSMGESANNSVTDNSLVTAPPLNSSSYCMQNQAAVDSVGEAEGGYTLAAGATATFVFSGSISMGGTTITVTPIVGNTYNIGAIGEDAASASTNVTAVAG